ncbi:hypothetical protein DFH08DRAFT_834733 [Mycena albidolilacea]|uniref:Uncharacterized protein n=1 Tax=Mycena albidolilacea TaxID=1033008 RepID=A0AAD7AR82_9AGAR|nr:hypothetical protein DFH08DRAFT_834733 [Mycena albidolilacea]
MPRAHSVPNSQTLSTKVGPKGISNANLISFSSNSMKPAQRSSLGRFLTSLDVAPFPALRQIEHADCYWPITERDISRSQWVRWAESLLERNIQLVDRKGTHWRPRLKYVPNSKR